MPTPTPTPAPFTGYKPGLAMPVIAPPPIDFTGTYDDYYQQLQIDLTITVSGTDGSTVEITMTSATDATNPVDPTLFAGTGGFVRYYAAGNPLPSPDALSDPVRNALVLQVWLGDVEGQGRAFPSGIAPISRIYYLGVDPVATRPVLRTEVARMSEAALRASWKTHTLSAPPPATSLDDLIDAHTERVMASDGSVFVEAGTAIGKMAKDPAATVDTYVLDLLMTDNAAPPAYVPPLPIILGLPYYEL